MRAGRQLPPGRIAQESSRTAVDLTDTMSGHTAVCTQLYACTAVHVRVACPAPDRAIDAVVDRRDDRNYSSTSSYGRTLEAAAITYCYYTIRYYITHVLVQALPMSIMMV